MDRWMDGLFLTFFLSIQVFICRFIYSSIHLTVHPSIHPFNCLSIHPFNCPSIHPSTHLTVRPSIHPYIHLGSSTESSFRRKAFKKKEDENHTHNNSAISISSIDISLDEENEAHYTMGLMVDIEELYEPMSLCLVSKFAVYDALQVTKLIICPSYIN